MPVICTEKRGVACGKNGRVREKHLRVWRRRVRQRRVCLRRTEAVDDLLLEVDASGADFRVGLGNTTLALVEPAILEHCRPSVSLVLLGQALLAEALLLIVAQLAKRVEPFGLGEIILVLVLILLILLIAPNPIASRTLSLLSC